MASGDYGFNFRATFDYVTDGTDETYVLAETSSQTRNGITFVCSGSTLNTRDRSSSVDRRVAGVNFANSTTGITFSPTLPSTGTYDVRAAVGDASNDTGYTYFAAKDNTTTFIEFTHGSGTTGANKYYDATDVERTSDTDWASNNAAVQRVYGATNASFIAGNATGLTELAHIRITEVGGGGSPTPSRMALLGVG